MKKLLVDMDEVLADYTSQVLETLLKEEHVLIKKEDHKGKYISEIIDDQLLVKVSDYPNRPNWFRTLAPIDGAIEALQKLHKSKAFDIYILTAIMRFPNGMKSKIEWLEEYFPFFDHQHIIFADCKHMIDGDIMIDDQPKHIERFRGEGILFGAWHNHSKLPSQRASSWDDVLSKLLPNALSNSQN